MKHLGINMTKDGRYLMFIGPNTQYWDVSSPQIELRNKQNQTQDPSRLIFFCRNKQADSALA
jgi:hypothetical protein